MNAGSALVTGATGFLGSHIARALVQNGYRVRALHRSTSSFELIKDLDLELVQGDLFEPASLQRAARSVDLVIHCAGMVASWRDPERMIASHVQGTRNVLQAALRQRVGRFVHLSSVASLGIPHNRSDATDGMSESHVWNSHRLVWPYGYAKWRAELEVWRAVAAGLDGRIAIPSYVLGPGGQQRRSGSRLAQLTRVALPAAPAGGLNVVHIQDVVDGVLATAQRGHPGRRYLLVGHNLSFMDLLIALAEGAGHRPPRWELPSAPLRAVGKAAAALAPRAPWLPPRLPMLSLLGHYFYYDDRRTRSDLGLGPPKSLESTLQADVQATT